MTTLAKRYPFQAFYGLAVTIVCVVMLARRLLSWEEVLPALWAFLEDHDLYANAISIALFALEDSRAFLIFVFAGAPTVAALVVSAWADGGRGVRRLLERFRLWGDVPREQGLRVYWVLALIYGGGIGVYLGITAFFGAEGALAQTVSSRGGWLSLGFWLLVGPFVDEGGTFEELGWRGFALPLLLDRYRSPLGATFLLGFLWWAWHFPREIPNLLAGGDLGTWAFWQLVFLLLCIALSVLMTTTFFATGGSVWPAILIHGFTNVWSKALSTPVYEVLGVDLRSLLVVAAAALVLVLTRGRLGAPAEVDD